MTHHIAASPRSSNTSGSGLRFLVVDDNPGGRFLVAKTVLRKFPKAAITECQDAETAFGILATEVVSLIVSHRTYEFDGVTLIREFRKRNSTIPILMMSGVDQRDAALAAGASEFLTYDQWLLAGNHVANLLTGGQHLNGSAEPTGVVPA